MKRIYLLILLVLLISTAGCGGNTATKSSVDAADQDTPAVSEPVPDAREPATEEDIAGIAEENQDTQKSDALEWSAFQGQASTSGGDDDDAYFYLDEFISLYYSDPGGGDSEEERVAFQESAKNDYDKWVSGEDFRFIIIDSTGHLAFDDRSAEFAGTWWDERSLRCHMDIACYDGTYFTIDINWSSSASENTHWVFHGSYDYDRGGISYYGSCYNEIAEDDGIQSTTVYESGTGLLYIGNNGYLYWIDDVEDMGSRCLFFRE